jgi:hypothetical protein
MKLRYIALIVLIFFLAGMILACGSKEPKTRKISGTLDNWTTNPPQVTISGTNYPAAAGMLKFVEKAEKGKTYEFTIDQFGNVIGATPK